MSWMKRRGHTTTSPTNLSSPQMYSANQHSNQESQWQQQDLSSNNWFNQSMQNQPTQQPYPYNPTQDQTNYWQPQYNPHNYAHSQPNQYRQQQIYNQRNPQQNYYSPATTEHTSLNDQYNQQTQHYNYNKTEIQNNPYGIQHQQQQLQQQQAHIPEQDSWGNWGWGEEDNSNIKSTQNINANTNQIADSFTTEESWNWSVDESSSSTSTLNYVKPEHSTATTSLTSLDSFKHQQEGTGDQLFPKMDKLADKHNSVLDSSETQTNKNLSQEPAKMPSIMRIRNSDNLTPQWSMESQMSQESSDDILQTSESDKMLSRSSTISQSPISGHDGISENVLPPQEIQNNKDGLISTLDSEQKSYPTAPHYENVEILGNVNQEPSHNFVTPPLPQNNLGTLKSHTPSPPTHNLTSPSSSQAIKTHSPPPPMKNQTPPLVTAYGSSDDSKNPYKRTTPLTHTAANKNRILNPSASDRPQPPGFQPFSQSVNLETLPDNSEQPDSLLPLTAHQSLKKSVAGLNNGNHQIHTTQSIPDNNEVAPINERNQYLETGQLSDESTNQLHVENMDAFPPPGLRRMVLGQIETNDTNLNVPADEPPPGLSRMVLGQTESSSSLANVLNARDSNGPPVGFSRMVPGESSSPESNSRHQYQVYQDDRRHEEYNSEVELNQLHATAIPQTRSATIGADTPPTVANPVITQSNMNRSETIGSDLKPDDSRAIGSISENRVGAMGVDRDQREDNLIGANQDSLHSNENRRDSIEGQPEDSEVMDLVSGVRDITVSTDVGISNRQESSDSDREIDRTKSPRDHRDRRYRDKEDRREKNRSRYSPDNYRDRRYEKRRPRDRRYDDDTDYYSDKEKDIRRDDRKDDYEKRYGSSRSKDKEKDRRKRDGRDRRDTRDDRDGRDGRDSREYDRRDRDYHREYDRRDRNRSDYYYGHYDDGYDGQRSRPSSRSDSMHESYRDRHDHRRQRPRDRDRDPRRHRDFNPYMQGFNYDPYNPYYQQYQYYYENLRRTNPQGYAEWYRKYFQQAGIASSAANFSTEDRGSVHSGRSSANDDIKERYSRPFDATDSVLDDSTTQVQRLTPAKFATAHVKASISSGKLIKVLPNYPLDGQNAIVELLNIQNLLHNDDEIEELAGFPGPLIRGLTHKKTVIEYCENKIKNAAYNDTITDPSSYILLWELMILLIRQNGMVVGTDIAELLMKDRGYDSLRPSSVVSNASSAIIEGNTLSEASNVQPSEITNTTSTSVLKEEIVTNKFREYLIYGSGKEALEWAMKHGLWGHALFLASKLDKRTYANVMMRFANGLTMNDPLQTLYQLLSGRIPAAVTAVADEKWGDWRPHLAMIVSNTTSRPELDRKSITTLADTLMARGSIYAAQFCYLMAEVGFNRYGTDNAKLVLLGSNHNKPFTQFATNEAIHLTEIYEYACSLNDAGFLILDFQPYKYLIASRLSDRGLLEKSLAYLERVSLAIIQNPSAMQPSLIDRVCHLADRLKYYDPVEDSDENLVVEGELDISRPDNSWLKDLKAIQNDYNMGLISHESVNDLIEVPPDYESLQTQQIPYENQNQMQDMWQAQQQQQIEQYQQSGYGQWQTEQQVDQQPTEQQEGYVGQYQEQQPQYWPQQAQQHWGGEVQPVINYDNQTVQGNQLEQESLQPQNDYWNNAQNEDSSALRSQITMPNQSNRQTSADSDEVNASKEKTPKPSPTKVKPAPKNEKPSSSSGWFGGIFSKMGLRPKNQMKLPDDKNPSIVWDPEKKKWVNLDEDGSETNNEMKPPPKMSEILPKLQPDNNNQPGIDEQPYVPFQHANPTSVITKSVLGQGQILPNFTGQVPYGTIPANPPTQMNPAGNPGGIMATSVGDEAPKSTQPNMFKLQRGRNLKKSYVDVFNPSGKTSEQAMFLGATPSGNSQVNFFVPAPVNDPHAPVDFLTPGNVNIDNSQAINHQLQ